MAALVSAQRLERLQEDAIGVGADGSSTAAVLGMVQGLSAITTSCRYRYTRALGIGSVLSSDVAALGS